MANSELPKNNNELSADERGHKISEFRKKFESIYEAVSSREALSQRLDLIEKGRNALEAKIKGDGRDPQDFAFWRMIIGSSPSKNKVYSNALDTPEGDIEKLVDSLIS